MTDIRNLKAIRKKIVQLIKVKEKEKKVLEVKMVKLEAEIFLLKNE